jgi:hypothetical protein
MKPGRALLANRIGDALFAVALYVPLFVFFVIGCIPLLVGRAVWWLASGKKWSQW